MAINTRSSEDDTIAEAERHEEAVPLLRDLIAIIERLDEELTRASNHADAMQLERDSAIQELNDYKESQ